MSGFFYSNFLPFSKRWEEKFVISFSRKKDRQAEAEEIGVESTFSAVNCTFDGINNSDECFVKFCELDDTPGFIISMKGVSIRPITTTVVDDDKMPHIIKRIMFTFGWVK